MVACGNMKTSTVNKIEQLHLSLCREFPAVGEEHVRELLDLNVEELIQRAHFDDFVPLLAYRHVREHIRDGALDEASFA